VCEYEKENLDDLNKVVEIGGGVKKALWRSRAGEECAVVYGDLCGAEEVIRGIVSGDGVGEMEDGKIV
jgi:hypothetical protein